MGSKGEEEEKPERGAMSFWDHLDELASRVKKVLISIAIATVAVLMMPADLEALYNIFGTYRPFITFVLQKLQKDLLPPDVRLIAARWPDPVEAILLMGLTLGLIISSPVIAYHFYKFINPALYEWERKPFYGFMAAFLSLFAVGVVFSYMLIIPFTFRILTLLAVWSGAEPLFTIADFVRMIMLLLLGGGLAFTIPAIYVLLVRFGIVGTEAFSKRRPYIYAGLFILIAIVTPDPTIVTDAIILAPLVALMEGANFVAKKLYEKPGQKGRQRL